MASSAGSVADRADPRLRGVLGEEQSMHVIAVRLPRRGSQRSAAATDARTLSPRC